jgi:hypothetical protein
MSSVFNDMARVIEEPEDENDALICTLARIESINEEGIPGEMVWRMSDGENPTLVWREHRGLTRDQVADAAGLPVEQVQPVDSGDEEPGFLAMAEIARVLRVEMEMLLPVLPEGRARR